MSTTQGPPPTVGIDDAFGRGFAGVRRELADLVDTPTWSLDDSRLDARISEALAVRAAADELVARLVAEAADRNLPHRHGASSTRAHLMTAHRMSAGEASRTVRTAKQLHGTSAVTEPTRRAVAAGAVSAEQGVVIAAAINRLSPTVEPDRVEAAQQDLLAHAQTLSYSAAAGRGEPSGRGGRPRHRRPDVGAAARRAGTQGVGLGLVHRPVRVRRHRPRPVRAAEPGVRHAHQTPRGR